MSKTRKQHIENLKHLLTYKIIQTFVRSSSIQYAIDHLSREWVRMSTHKKLKKEFKLSEDEQVRLMKEKNELQHFYVQMQQDYNELNMRSERALKEIDHLKADKDRLQRSLNVRRALSKAWKQQYKELLKDWEKESDKVSNLQKKVKWLSITTAILFIVLIISLF